MKSTLKRPAWASLPNIAFVLAIIVAYLGLAGMAPPYPSETVMVMQEGYKETVMPDLASTGLLAGLTEKSNLRVLKQLIFAGETFQEVDRQTGFVAYFREHGNPFEQWLAGQTDPARRRQLLEHVVDARVDDRAGLLVMTVRAHDPAVAQQISRSIVSISQHRVNELAQLAALDQMGFLEHEAKRLLGADQDVQRRLVEFQNRTGLTAAEIGIAAPQISVGGLGGGAGGGGGGAGGAAPDPLLAWQQRVGDLKVSRQTLKQFLRGDAPEIQSLDAEIAAVQGQIDQRKNELLARKGSGQGGTSVGEARLEFAGLLAEAQLSRELYLGALRSIAQARSDASRTLKRVDLVEAPTLPTESNRAGGWMDLFAAIAIGALVRVLIGLTRRYVDSHND